MSKRYPGGLITKTPVTPTPSSAPGIWTLEQQLQAQQSGTWPYGGPFTYIEDVFSTYLYTGTGATQTITNNINLSGSGGLVWIKDRTNAYNHNLFDTAQGATKLLHSNTTDATVTDANSLTAFGTTGFTLGSGNTSGSQVNTSADNFVSWTFRKQTKFFDVVTYSGTGANRTISHNLGSAPGCIVVKRTDTTANWQVYHNGFTSAAYSAQLNLTNAQASAPTVWNSTAPTSSVFSVGTSTDVNASGGTYVAYLFAHNAGGFGLTSTDNVISCGAVTLDGSGNATVSLGYEPQWILMKRTNSASGGSWFIYDTMRGMSQTSGEQLLANNAAAATADTTGQIRPSATGFNVVTSGSFIASAPYIYIAIRRGPMKVPTSGTSVFSPLARAGNGAQTAVGSTSFAPDLFFTRARNSANDTYLSDRLRGNTVWLDTAQLFSESDLGASPIVSFNQNGWTVPAGYAMVNQSGTNYVDYFVQRAPSFCDEVCYTGTGSNTTQTHNLGAVPELLIVKERSAASSNGWPVWNTSIANTQYLLFNTTNAVATGATYWNSTTPTSTVFSLGTNTDVNASGQTYVAWLFASCPGVSKVGSYSGTGATQTIDCGFTGGARMVWVKRTDTTGAWYFWDTARGMVAGTDPSLQFNATAAEVNANSVYTTGVGFQIVSTAAGINASGGTYIYLAIA
jgi:hypothetical protein